MQDEQSIQPWMCSVVQACKLGSTEPGPAINLRLVQLVRLLLENSSNHLCIDNLPASVSEAELHAALSHTPGISGVTLLPRRPSRIGMNGSLSGSALLQLVSADAVNATADKLNGLVLDGHTLSARRAGTGYDAQVALQSLVDAHQQRLKGREQAQAGKVRFLCLCILAAKPYSLWLFFRGQVERRHEWCVCVLVQDAATTVCLKGVFNRADVSDISARQALQHDITHEVSAYGQVLSVEISLPVEEGEVGTTEANSWTGDVLLRYENALGAQRAAEALAGRFFGNVPLRAVLEGTTCSTGGCG
jgi:hypothetical protein